MITEKFSNKLYESTIRDIEAERIYKIRHITDEADLNAIIRLSDVKYNLALIDEYQYDMLEEYFRNMLTLTSVQSIDDVNRGNITFVNLKDASDFLTCCKLFVKVSSEYTLVVDNGDYIFDFNLDRLDEIFYDREEETKFPNRSGKEISSPVFNEVKYTDREEDEYDN
jgi:hypothetical protein